MSFKNSVVIMTSNIGSRWILDPDLNEVEMDHLVSEAMRATFKPEFLNRVDDVLRRHLIRQQAEGAARVHVRSERYNDADRHPFASEVRYDHRRTHA